MRFLLLWFFALMFCSHVDAQSADVSLQMIPLEHEGIPTFTWSNDGDLLAISATQDIRIYRIGETDPILLIPDQNSIQELAFNHNGSLLASVDNNLIVHVWDTETGQSIASRGFGDYGFVTRLNFHPHEAVLTLSF